MAGNTGQKGHTIMKNQLVIVLDFGGQYNQLIARRVRECGVYCEVMRDTTPIAELAARNPVGIIFTGGPNSVYDPKSPHVDPAIFELGIPILGICYGCQLMAYTLGGTVASSEETREYGKTLTEYQTESLLFTGLPKEAISWMSHTDYIQKLIGKTVPVVKDHPFVTTEGAKAQEVKTEELKAKAKENKVYRGSRSNGDFWRRKKQAQRGEQQKK